MNCPEEVIRKFALFRIAKIFNVAVDSLRLEQKFDEDLRAATTTGLFKRNEYDQLENDIYDVANKSIYKEISSGNLTIQTVADYCDHMVRCYETNPEDVKHVLKISE